MEKVKVGKYHIAFERKGKGPALILLHGALADSRVWRRQLDVLSNEFTTVAWDAPGCGQSSDPPETFTPSDFADCLAEFLHKINISHPHVLGLSFGGGLALALYRNNPDIPRTLVLASTYAGWKGSLRRETVDERLQKGLAQSNLPANQVVEAWLPTLYSKSAPPGQIDELKTIMSEFHPQGMRAMLLAFAKADLRIILPNIHVPTLLLYGDADQRSPLSIAQKLNAAIEVSRLVVLPGIGHVSNIEAPERFNNEVMRFLKANS
jgi:pimeloyl-ACP methyl ester carboxylesterase